MEDMQQQMKCQIVLQRISFQSFFKMCSLLSFHFGIVLALLFLATNNGRRINFGTYFFYGGEADVVGFLFIFMLVNGLLLVVALLCFYPVNLSLRLFGGMRVTGAVREND